MRQNRLDEWVELITVNLECIQCDTTTPLRYEAPHNDSVKLVDNTGTARGCLRECFYLALIHSAKPRGKHENVVHKTFKIFLIEA